jgi:hypothetical protein
VSPETSIVVSSLVAGVVLTVVGWLRCGAVSAAPTKVIGDPTWDFSKSWASNVTVVGAILGTVLSAKVLPATTVVVSPSGYTALSLLFGALVVVAPLLFVATRKGRADAKGPVYTGYGWAFLVASSVTLWGVIGQLTTVGLVLYEAEHSTALARGAVIPVWCVIGLALLLVVVYGQKSIRLTLTPPPPPDGLAPPVASTGWTVL